MRVAIIALAILATVHIWTGRIGNEKATVYYVDGACLVLEDGSLVCQGFA